MSCSECNDRFTAIERRIRRTNILAAAAFAGSGLVFLMGLGGSDRGASQPSGVTTAPARSSDRLVIRELVIVDGNGTEAMRLDAAEGGGRLVVLRDGKLASSLVASREGAMLSLCPAEIESPNAIVKAESSGGKILLSNNQASVGVRLGVSKDNVATVDVTGGALNIQDSQGKLAVRVCPAEGGGGMIGVQGSAGQPAVVLGGTQAGGGIVVGNSEGVPHVLMGASTAGGTLEIRNRSQRPALSIDVNDFGAGRVVTRDPEGRSLVGLSQNRGGTGSVSIQNGQGKELIVLSATDAGGSLAVQSNQGKELLRLMAMPTGHGAVFVADAEGRTLATIGATEHGGLLSALDTRSRPIFAAIGSPDGGHVRVSETLRIAGGLAIADPQDRIRIMMTAERESPDVTLVNSANKPGVTIGLGQDGAGEVWTWDLQGKGRLLSPRE